MAVEPEAGEKVFIGFIVSVVLFMIAWILLWFAENLVRSTVEVVGILVMVAAAVGLLWAIGDLTVKLVERYD